MGPDMPRPLQDEPFILVDGERVRAVGDELTGAEILALAGREPDRFELYAEGHRGLRIEPQQVVPVQAGSRFRTIPRI